MAHGCYSCPQFWKVKIRSCHCGHLFIAHFSVPLSEEAVKDVITILLRALAILGPCKTFKTDNAPAHTAKPFQEFS